MRLRILIAVLLFFLLPHFSFGQCDTMLHVKVIDKATKQPINTADVGIWDMAIQEAEFMPNYITNGMGIVSIRICPRKACKVSVNVAGYLPAVEKIESYYKDTLIIAMDTIIHR